MNIKQWLIEAKVYNISLEDYNELKIGDAVSFISGDNVPATGEIIKRIGDKIKVKVLSGYGKGGTQTIDRFSVKAPIRQKEQV